MRPYVVAGNWKMNTTVDEARLLAAAIRDGVRASDPGEGVRVMLCPPFPLLAAVRETAAASIILVGAQNMHASGSGAYTGEVSASMLRSVGCSSVILGHSERRQLFHEDDATVNLKVKQAFSHSLTPILCVGETLEQREAGTTEAVIEKQVRGSLADLESGQVRRLIMAYEPVWAIGTGKTATPEQAQEVHVYIRGLIASMYNEDTANALVLQYGGSVKADNAQDLFAQPDVDGGLIGGASLSAESFLAIIAAAATLSKG